MVGRSAVSYSVAKAETQAARPSGEPKVPLRRRETPQQAKEQETGSPEASSSGAQGGQKDPRTRSAAAKAQRKARRKEKKRIYKHADAQSSTSDVSEEDKPSQLNRCLNCDRISITDKTPRLCGFCGKPWYVLGR